MQPIDKEIEYVLKCLNAIREDDEFYFLSYGREFLKIFANRITKNNLTSNIPLPVPGNKTKKPYASMNIGDSFIYGIYSRSKMQGCGYSFRKWAARHQPT